MRHTRAMLRSACIAALCVGVATANELTLLEASGSASGDAPALGRFCSAPTGKVQLALFNSTTGDIFILGGPTPHVLLHLPAAMARQKNSSCAATAADLDGDGRDELLVSNGETLSVFSIDDDCSAGKSIGSSTLSAPAASLAFLAAATPAGNGTVVAVGAKSPIALLRPLTKGQPGVLSLVGTLEQPALPGFAWRAAAAKGGKLLLARVADGLRANVRLLKYEHVASEPMPKFEPLASRNQSLASPLIGCLIEDFWGDGAASGLLVQSDSTVDTLWLAAGAEPLHSSLSSRAVLDPGRSWLAVTSGALLSVGVLPNEAQLVAARAPAALPSLSNFEARLLLYGRPEHWLRRAASFRNLRGSGEFKTTFNDSAHNVDGLMGPGWNVTQVKGILSSINANQMTNVVCDCVPDNVRRPDSWACSTMMAYADFVRFLAGTRDFRPNGDSFRVWMEVLPPSENQLTRCAVPPDSPLTPFNETAIFEGSNYEDYERWGILAGELAKVFPHLVAVMIDDFTDNVGQAYTGDSVARMTSAMRSRAPWLAFNSVAYVPFVGHGTMPTTSPDVGYMLDAPLFAYRDMVECATEADCPCAPASCPWGPLNAGQERYGQCLAGECADPTAANVASEIAAIAKGMPANREMIVSFYATGHSSGGQPTPRYVSRVMQIAAAQPRVAGLMLYTTKAAEHPCPDPPLFEGSASKYALPLQHQLGCIARRIYASMAQRV